jgi:anti-sigma B factor antagonist
MPINLPDPAGPCLQLRTQQTPEATFVKCYGRLTRDVVEILIAEVKPLLSQRKHIVLDFSQLAYLDSSGIGTVVRLYVSARNAGCELHLVNFNQRVRELLGVTHVLSALETCGQFMVKMP